MWQKKMLMLNQRFQAKLNNERTKKALYEASQATLETAKENAQQKVDELETAKAEEAKKASAVQTAKTDFETATLKQKSLNDLKAEIADTQEQIGAYQKAIEGFNGAITKLDETIGQLENEQASIEDVKGQVEKAYEAYKKLSADPTGFMDVVDSDNDVVLGLYSKMGSMRTAYEEYATALNVFLGVEAQWNANKEQLESASRDYETAKAELDKANKALTSYLDKIKKEEEAKKAEEEAKKKAEEEAKKAEEEAKKAEEEAKKAQSEAQKKTDTVNTGAGTALGFYALSGVLGLAGVAFTGKHARKED